MRHSSPVLLIPCICLNSLQLLIKYIRNRCILDRAVGGEHKLATGLILGLAFEALATPGLSYLPPHFVSVRAHAFLELSWFGEQGGGRI